ncbi:hypothetical protein HJFPF1_01098 [Paramyrothecium foliicola]|nr:hypothetical protein HJFPF1_01098 [Paramyrothecium foliicola]
MADFQFLVHDGASSRATAAMRSHAVRSGLLRKAASKAVGPEDAELTMRQKSTLTTRFRLANRPEGSKITRTRDKAQPLKAGQDDDEQHTSSVIHRNKDTAHSRTLKNRQAIVVTPSQARGDPFNVFPISQNEGVDRLIRFYISRFDLNVSISEIQKHWWGFAIYDPVVLHATLSLAAMTWAMLIPAPDEACQEGMRQKGYALRGVQERLDRNDTSDAVVGAVAALASIEAADADFRTGAAHIRGIQILCKARGGYSSFKDNLHVARAMNWADLQVAVGLGSRPLLPLIYPLESISLPPKVLLLAAEPSLSHLRVFESTQDDSSVRYSFSLLRQAYYGLKAGALPVQDLRVLINGTDYHLAHVLAGDNLTAHGRALLTAAQHFMYHVIRETDPECHIPALLLQRLFKQLIPLVDQIKSVPEMWQGLFWCFSIGAAVSPTSGDVCTFFSTNLWNMIRVMTIQDLSGFEEVVKRFLWDQSLSQRLLANQSLSVHLNPELS